MELTNDILALNGFADVDGLQTRSVTIDHVDYDVSFDDKFHILFRDNAYPMVTTVEDANTRLAALSTGIVLS